MVSILLRIRDAPGKPAKIFFGSTPGLRSPLLLGA
jgi:hypothetical protein